MTIEPLKLLLLIIIANGAPIVARQLVNNRYKLAIDLGKLLPDGRPLFGPSKTWRGAIAACLLTPFAGWLMGYPLLTGILIALFAIIGDLTSSFIKRRLAIKTSDMMLFIDQVPESLFPSLIVMETFKLDIWSVIIVVILFIISELLLSRILFIMGIRKRPH